MIKPTSRSRGVTLLEVIVVVGITMLFAGTLTFVMAPAVKEAGTKNTCAEHMHQIVTAYQMYLADHGDYPRGWKIPEVKPYLKIASFSQLFCPKARIFKGAPFSTYSDLLSLHARRVGSDIVPNRRLTANLAAPAFQPEIDVLLRCVQHGDQGYEPSDSIVPAPLIPKNLSGRVLSAYADGRVAYAPIISCWELPWTKVPPTYQELVPMYRNHPNLLKRCDGSLEEYR